MLLLLLLTAAAAPASKRVNVNYSLIKTNAKENISLVKRNKTTNKQKTKNKID